MHEAAAIYVRRQGNKEIKIENVMRIIAGDLDDQRVARLLIYHQRTAHAASPPGSSHALDLTELKAPNLNLWTIWQDNDLLGCGALRVAEAINSNDNGLRFGEVKSMHVVVEARRRGIGALMLRHIMTEAKSRGLNRLNLETGAGDYFAPAYQLYLSHGFRLCEPFPPYRPDPNTVFMTLDLRKHRP